MKKTIFLIFLAIFCTKNGVAQPDTILVGYKENDFGATSIQKSTLLSDGRLALIHSSSVSGYNLLIVDTYGNILHENSLSKIDDHTVLSYFDLIEDDTTYVLVGNTMKNGKRYFSVFSVDKTLENVKIIDTFSLSEDVRLYFNEMRFNAQKNLWEAFGVVQNANSTTTILNYFYVGIKKDYTFDRLKEFQPLKFTPNHILDFCWVEDAKRYILGGFNSATILVDEDINTVYESTTKFSYLHNGSMATIGLRLYNCLDIDGNIVFCHMKESWDRPYNAAFVKLEVKSDTVVLLEATPLSAPPLGVQVESIMRRDHVGNYIISGSNEWPWPGKSNILKVVKFSSTFDKIWEFAYQSDKGFLIFDMQVDQHSDIVLVGQAWNIFGDGTHRGFLMKVHSNGTLSSYEEVPGDPHGKYAVRIMPNPATSHLCLQTTGTAAAAIRFWDANGRLILSEKPTAPLYCFDLPPNLPPGIYITETLFADGYRTVQKSVVVR